MSLEHSTYIGCFIFCKNEEMISKKEFKMLLCINKCVENLYDSSQIFCPYCGEKLIESINVKDVFHYKVPKDEIYEVTNNSIRDISDFVPNIDHLIEIWLPNKDYSSNEEGVTIITDKVKKNSITNFAIRYNIEIEILKTYYGEENVKIHFGVISYYS